MKSTSSTFHPFTLVASRASALTNGEKTHINAVRSSQTLYFHTNPTFPQNLPSETCKAHTCPMFMQDENCWPIIKHLQVLGIGGKPSQFKSPEKQTSRRRSWSGNDRFEKPGGCRFRPNNETSRPRSRRESVVVNVCQELVFRQIPWSLRKVLPSIMWLWISWISHLCAIITEKWHHRPLHTIYLTSPPPPARTDHVLGPQMVQPFLIVSSGGQLTVTDSRQCFLVQVDSMPEQFVFNQLSLCWLTMIRSALSLVVNLSIQCCGQSILTLAQMVIPCSNRILFWFIKQPIFSF